MVAQFEGRRRIGGLHVQPRLDAGPDDDRAFRLEQQHGAVVQGGGARQRNGAVGALVGDGAQSLAQHVAAIEDDGL